MILVHFLHELRLQPSQKVFRGFTGSYNAGLGGDAEVTMTGRTYDITGTADGFDTENPSFRTSGEFSIKVAC